MMTHPISLLAFVALLACPTAFAADSSWFCREDASEKTGNTLLACGVDTDPTEHGARKKALAAAFEELDAVCDRSADCKRFELEIEPKRSECIKEGGGYKCYRALRATITQAKRTEAYLKGETLKRALERIEITVRTETAAGSGKGGGLGFTSAPSCEADIKPLSDALLDLSTQERRDHVASEAIKVPFSTGCARVHEKLLTILARNKLVLPAYTTFLLTGLEAIADPSEDDRAEYVLEYFHSLGQMQDREWKASLAVVNRAHSSYRLLSHIFYPAAEGDSAQALEKKRVDAFFAAVQRGEYGKPVATGPDWAAAELIRAVTGYGDKRRNWLGLHAYSRFRPALKYEKADRLAEALATLSQVGDDEKSRNWVNEWMAEIAQKAKPSRELSLSLERYIEHLDESLKKQDDEEDSGSRQIVLIKALKAAFIAKAGPGLGQNLNVTYDDSDRRSRAIFCLKNGISCPDLVPDKDRLVKLLKSKKALKRVEALELLRWMPKVASGLEEDLLLNLEEPAAAGLDAGEYMGRVNSEALHVLAALPSPSVKVYRRLIELDVSVNDREDREKFKPGWEPQLLIALRSSNVRIRAAAARALESFDKLSQATCSSLMKETKGREPTSYQDYPANLARKCKGRGSDWE